MHNKTIVELSQDLATGEYSSVQLTRHCLDRIERLDGDLNCFISILAEPALRQAEEADKRRAKGDSHPLLGIPLAFKDIFCAAGTQTTCGSRMLENFISPYDATVVTRLQSAGAVMIGKANMDEFAMGSSTENSYFGPTLNPWNRDHVPGGSSGGSAAAVAARLCPAATGTDTGGSIRQPASFCGVTGLKPTYGRISRWGMIAFASSLDQAGPLTRSAEDAAILLSAMAGHDPKDSTSINSPAPDYQATINDSIKGMKIGVCREYLEAGLDEGVRACVTNGISELEKLGATITEVSLPHIGMSIPAYYIIAPAECSANLARFDGVRFGRRCEKPEDLSDLYRRSRSEGFGTEVKSRIMVGTFALSAGYYDAYYRKAQQIRRLIRDDFANAFKKVDLLVGPTAPTPAFKLGEKVNDQIAMYLQDIFTIATNLAGLPAASIPAGFVDNLPVGLQVIGNYLDEERLLRLCHRFQQQTDWHLTCPSFAA